MKLKSLRLISLIMALVLALGCVGPVSAHAAADDSAEEEFETIRYQWKSHDNKKNLWMEFSVWLEAYWQLADYDRVLEPEKYAQQYIQDPLSHDVVMYVTACFEDIGADVGYEKEDLVPEMLNFVQTKIKSANDMKTKDQEDYPRYPLETLYEAMGDSQDRSILLAAMIHELGYGAAIIQVGDHFAVGIKTTDDYSGGEYYQLGSERWLFMETTNKKYKVGQIPKKYADQPATFYFLE